jgi:hypothetical protein
MGNVITDMLQNEYVWVSGCYNPLYYIIYHYIIYTHMLYLYIQSVKTVCDPLRHPLFSNFTAHRSRSFDLPCIVCQQKLSHNDIIHMYLTSMYIYIYTYILLILFSWLPTHSLTYFLTCIHACMVYTSNHRYK